MPQGRRTPARDRYILDQFYKENMTLAEIADELSMGYSAVGQVVSRNRPMYLNREMPFLEFNPEKYKEDTGEPDSPFKKLERNMQILEEVGLGGTYKEVGRKHGISTTAAHKIVQVYLREFGGNRETQIENRFILDITSTEPLEAQRRKWQEKRNQLFPKQHSVNSDFDEERQFEQESDK